MTSLTPTQLAVLRLFAVEAQWGVETFKQIAAELERKGLLVTPWLCTQITPSDRALLAEIDGKENK